MATVNLGSIKFKWKGTYSGATAYTVDDVVSYNGSSYICILASTGNLPTNATYFEQMSSAGTNGTDLTTTLTTQGDLVYRDGSGLVRLGAGTAGQVLQTGGAGANPSWTDVGGGLLQYKIAVKTGTQSIASSSGVAITNTEVSLTPASASNKILVRGVINFGGQSNLYESGKLYRKIGSGSYAVVSGAVGDADGSATRSTFPMQMVSTGNPDWKVHTTTFEFLDTPNTTQQVYYQLYAGFDGDDLRINEEQEGSSGIYDTRPITTISISELSSTIL
jgi:hypothetical protein